MSSEPNRFVSKNTSILQGGLLLICSILFALIIAEIALRVLSIPGTQLDVAVYDDLVGGLYYPGSTLTYRSDRGEFVQRKVNQWGYLDKNYLKEKASEGYRIGFFGDSFTAAKQVPLEDTFFRLIENRLSPFNVETLAFGRSGFSTLQSYLTYKERGVKFDLDIIVYVFYENDPGDQIREIKRKSTLPYPVLEDAGFSVDNSFRELGRKRDTLYHRISNYLTANFLVFATISSRLSLVARYGIGTPPKTDLQHGVKDKGLPGVGGQPSTWPKELRIKTEKTLEAVLAQWLADTENDSRLFVILYVPRATDVEGTTREEDSWKPWVKSYATAHGIQFIDPSDDLRANILQGNEMYYDHFTKNGHAVFANAFVSWFERHKERDNK